MSQNPLRVVIAEDEALIRLDLKEMLEEEGYSVVAEAGDGESAVGHVSTLRERLEVRKLLDRAKGLLQSEHGLTEPEAFRWIQKTSMDRRLTMRKVAEAVIEGSMGVPAETPQPQP